MLIIIMLIVFKIMERRVILFTDWYICQLGRVGLHFASRCHNCQLCRSSLWSDLVHPWKSSGHFLSRIWLHCCVIRNEPHSVGHVCTMIIHVLCHQRMTEGHRLMNIKSNWEFNPSCRVFLGKCTTRVASGILPSGCAFGWKTWHHEFDFWLALMFTYGFPSCADCVCVSRHSFCECVILVSIQMFI